MSTPDFDAVILAGGRATRMGGADKPALLVGNHPMVVTVARAAAAAGAGRLIIVGPRRDGPVLDALEAVAASGAAGAGRAVLRFALEDPPGSGPVPALRCGLAEVAAPWLVLLAADLPFLSGSQLTGLLGSARAAGRAGALLTDADGRPQWLAGAWQADVLRAALDGYAGNSLHGLLAPLEPVLVPAAGHGAGLAPAWLDCDTLAELAAARRLRQDRRSRQYGQSRGAGAEGSGTGDTEVMGES